MLAKFHALVRFPAKVEFDDLKREKSDEDVELGKLLEHGKSDEDVELGEHLERGHSSVYSGSKSRLESNHSALALCDFIVKLNETFSH